MSSKELTGAVGGTVLYSLPARRCLGWAARRKRRRSLVCCTSNRGRWRCRSPPGLPAVISDSRSRNQFFLLPFLREPGFYCSPGSGLNPRSCQRQPKSSLADLQLRTPLVEQINARPNATLRYPGLSYTERWLLFALHISSLSYVERPEI